MTGKSLWFEGIPFPSLDYSPELLREVQESFLVKDEDVLLLTFPKSGKEAGSGTDRLWLWPSSFSRQMEGFLYAGNALGDRSVH